MIYHPTELMLDDRQREKLQGYDPGFPYTAIDCRFDGYSGPCVDCTARHLGDQRLCFRRAQDLHAARRIPRQAR